MILVVQVQRQTAEIARGRPGFRETLFGSIRWSISGCEWRTVAKICQAMVELDEAGEGAYFDINRLQRADYDVAARDKRSISARPSPSAGTCSQ